MEFEKVKIIKDELETEVELSEITSEVSPFKEILEKTEYYSYTLSFSEDKTYSLENVFHLLVNVKMVGEFSFFFALDSFKKKEIVLKIRELKNIEVIDEESAQKKIEAMFEIINNYEPVFLVYNQTGEYILGRKGVQEYVKDYPYFYFGNDIELEEMAEEEELEIEELPEEKVEEKPEENNAEEEKEEPVPANRDAFEHYLRSNFTREKVRKVHRILNIQSDEEEAFYNYLLDNYSPEQVKKVCKTLGINNPLLSEEENEKPSFVTKEEEENVVPEEKPEENQEKVEEEKEEKKPGEFSKKVKDIWSIIVGKRFSFIFVLIAALIVELAIYLGFNYAFAGKGISVFFFICSLVGAGLNGFVHFDLFNDSKVDKKMMIIISVIYFIGALIGLGGYAIFYALQKDKPEMPSFIVLTLITLLISFSMDAIAVLIAKLVSKKYQAKKNK